MTDHRGAVVAGVDAHTDEHHVAVLDLQGRLLGAAAFPTTGAGYARLIGWLRRHGPVERVGVESTGAYAAGLVRALEASGICVVEVNQPHPHARQRLEKSDPIDAESPPAPLSADGSRAAQADERHRRVDPPAERGQGGRAEGAHGRAAAARRSRDHRA